MSAPNSTAPSTPALDAGLDARPDYAPDWEDGLPNFNMCMMPGALPATFGPQARRRRRSSNLL